MDLRFTTVNNVPVADASKNGLLTITTRALYRDGAGFNYDGGGYGWDGYDPTGYDRDGFNKEGYDRGGFNKEGYNRDGLNKEGYDRNGFDRWGFNKEGYTVDEALYDKNGFNKEGWNEDGFDRDGYNAEGYNTAGYDRAGYDKKGYGGDGYNRSGNKRWSPVPASTSFELLVTLRLGSNFIPGFTVGLFGAYGSFSFGSVESDEPSVESDEPSTDDSDDFSPSEFVVGYTLNLQSKKGAEFLSGWGLPLGIGYNTLRNQLVLEIGLQLRGVKPYARRAAGIELRGTYRLIGFRDHGFTISFGWW
jgi:hypothetical protein